MLQSKRGGRDSNDGVSGDDETGSPLHVLSDAAQQENQLEEQPRTAANGAHNMALPRMQRRHSGAAAVGSGERPFQHVMSASSMS